MDLSKLSFEELEQLQYRVSTLYTEKKKEKKNKHKDEIRKLLPSFAIFKREKRDGYYKNGCGYYIFTEVKLEGKPLKPLPIYYSTKRSIKPGSKVFEPIIYIMFGDIMEDTFLKRISYKVECTFCRDFGCYGLYGTISSDELEKFLKCKDGETAFIFIYTTLISQGVHIKSLPRGTG